MTTENLENQPGTTEQKPKLFTNEEVEQMMKERTEKERLNSRLKNEENEKLKRKLEELEAKFQKGTASTEDMQQLDAAKQTAAQTQAQGYTPEQMQQAVDSAIRQNQYSTNLQDAYKKDPEFKKLVDGNKGLTDKGAPNGLYAEELSELTYLPNAIAVTKHLLKDPKSLQVYKTALQRAYQTGSPVEVMMVLNNFSDRLADKQETTQANTYEPATPLSDASDESQNFDLKNYINSKY